jgi:signal transduction histidine kinase
MVASSGFYTHLDGAHGRVPLGAFKIGLIAQGRGKTISNDVPNDERVHDRDWAKQHGLRAFAGFPIVQEDRVVGVMAMFSRSVLPEHLLTTLELLADLAASALENVRHFQLELELEQARKLESVGQLAAGVAHEINSPLQFIGDNIEFISECTEKLFEVVRAYDRILGDVNNPKAWGQRRQEIAEVINKARFEQIMEQMPAAAADSLEGVKRVMDIVRAMRQFSHPGTDEMTETDLNEAIRNTLIITRNRWKCVADAETTLDPDLTLVPAFAAEISQVLLNLVVNAADAITEKIGADPDDKGRISIRSRCDADHVVVEIEDTGCGIPDSVRSRIFDPFFTTKDVGKGTGQGLAICRNIVVNKHHGSIELDSTLGLGSCFRVILPRIGASKVDGSGSDDGAIEETSLAAGVVV